MRDGPVVQIREEPVTALAEHAQISIAFRVSSVLDVRPVAGGAHELHERSVEHPYVKDYDATTDGSPLRWAERFDLTKWGLIGAYAEGRRVGGVVIAFDTPGVDMLEGRSDLAVLWDVRVAPEWRRRGIGARLFAAAESWARARGCRQLKVETQNVNVAACRFYARQGYVLAAIDPLAYPELPDEVQLLWVKDL